MYDALANYRTNHTITPEQVMEYTNLRDYLSGKEMLTHLFYVDELIDDCTANNDDLPPMFEAITKINTQARLDLWFQDTHNDSLDYCHDKGDGTWSCMLVDSQIEYIVRPDFVILSASDGMGDD